MVWEEGDWTSQTLTNSLGQFPAGVDTSWGLLLWEEENTTDESMAYVRVDILKSSDDSVLAADLYRNEETGGVDLSVYPLVGSNNIKIKFKLFADTLIPIVKNVEINFKTAW